MTELLETLESIDAEAASVQRIFHDAGTSVRTLKEARQRQDPTFMTGLVEAARLIAAVKRGDWRAEYPLREAITTRDFPLFFGDILDRTVGHKYRSLTPT